MHIPDGYLSPKTCMAMFAVMAPVWYVSLKKVEAWYESPHGSQLGSRYGSQYGSQFGGAGLPLVSFLSAFVFVLMMFNFPLPGGTSGHVVGGAIVAIVLGRWAGVFVMSLALFLQAVMFGDGGITTFAANAFAMGLVMCFTADYSYRFLAGVNANKRRVNIAAFVSAYLAVNMSALAAALLLGLQPVIATHGASGVPLYAPYALNVTLPVVMGTHLFLLGPIEGLATALTVSFLFSICGSSVAAGGPVQTNPGVASGKKPLLIALCSVVILSPIGLLTGDSPWGEWNAGELAAMLGFIPEGMGELHGLWKGGVMPGYELAGVNNALAYVLSALAASVVSVLVIYMVVRLRRGGVRQ